MLGKEFFVNRLQANVEEEKEKEGAFDETDLTE